TSLLLVGADATALSSSSISRYFRPESHSSLCSTHNAVTSRRQASRFGKILTTLVLRFSSWLKRSRPFVVRGRSTLALRGHPLSRTGLIARRVRFAYSGGERGEAVWAGPGGCGGARGQG